MDHQGIPGQSLLKISVKTATQSGLPLIWEVALQFKEHQKEQKKLSVSVQSM